MTDMLLKNAKLVGLRLLAAGNRSVTFQGTEGDCFRFACKSQLGEPTCVWEADEQGDIHQNRAYDYCRFGLGAVIFPAGRDEFHITVPM